MILHLAIRVALILAGYGLASLASGLGVAFAFHAAENDPHLEFLPLVALITILIALYASVPALVCVVAGEAGGWRWRRYYIAVACLIGMALPLLVGLEHWYVLVGLGLGPVAGMIYWLVAGRGAGWRPGAAQPAAAP